MGDKIDFPKNFERYVDMGQEAMKNKNILQAVKYFLLAYEIEAQFPLNFLLTNTYYDIGENEKALKLSEDFVDDYHAHIEYFTFYIQLLLANRKFIEAHREINDRLYEGDAKEFDHLLRLKKEVRHNELLYRQFERVKINNLKEKLHSLPQEPFMKQMEDVKQMMSLTQDDFVEEAKCFLVNENVHLLVRNRILETLSFLGIQESIEFLWFDGTKKKVTPSEVFAPYENQPYKEVVTELDCLLGAVDPILLVNLMEEVRLFFALLYPLADEKVVEPKLWARSILLDYWHEYHIEDETKEDQEKIITINEQMKKLRNFFQLEQGY